MTSTRTQLRSVLLAALLVLSAAGATAAFAGTAAAAADASITADDQNAGAQGVTYTATGAVAVDNDTATVSEVEIDLGAADLSAVAAEDVGLTVAGEEYAGGVEAFTAAAGTATVSLSDPVAVADGDAVTVTLDGVRNPDADVSAAVSLRDANGTAVDAIADTVAIDPISYSTLWANATSVARNSPVGVTVIAENTADEAADYEADFRVDGETHTTKTGTLAAGERARLAFTPEFDAAGNYEIGVESLQTRDLTVYDSPSVVGATTGTADDARTLTVSVADLSLDGRTDWHYLELPNELAGDVTLDDVSATGRNVSVFTQSAELVDGVDDDDVDETLRFATTGSGGGTTNALLTATVTVDAAAGDYAVSAHVTDSTGRSASSENVAQISVAGAAPTTAANGTETPTETESNGSGGVPGFTAGAALVAAALVGAALLARRD